jgi:hypothetical protein
MNEVRVGELSLREWRLVAAHREPQIVMDIRLEP